MFYICRSLTVTYTEIDVDESESTTYCMSSDAQDEADVANLAALELGVWPRARIVQH